MRVGRKLDEKKEDKTGEKKGQKKAVARVPNACLCCEEMALPSALYCPLHSATDKVVARQMKWQTKETVGWIKTIKKDAKRDPQRRWVQMLLRVELKCPGLGNRAFRAKYNFVEHIERYSKKNGIRESYVARFMTKRMYFKWAVDEGGYTLKEADAEWVRMEDTQGWPVKSGARRRRCLSTCGTKWRATSRTSTL